MRKLLVILLVTLLTLAILLLLGWAVHSLAELFFEAAPELWKDFLEGVRQFGEACRGNKPS
jgi:hypothetical protein